VSHILRFRQDWPEAKVVRLETNYRSTREILAWANRLIAFNRRRHPKMLRATAQGEAPRILQLPDEQSEARTVVEDIRARIRSASRRPRDFAILCRTNEQPRAFEQELRLASVPYVLVGGMSFFDRREVRDLLAYAKVVVNPRDEISLLRIINTPPRGIGQVAVTRLMEHAVASGKPAWDLLAGCADLKAIPPAAAQAMAEFRKLVERYHTRAKDRAPVDLLRTLIDEIRYREELARRYPDPDDVQERWAGVEEFVNALGSYCKRAEQPTLAGFLHEVMLTELDEDRDKESKLQRDAVALMTLHAAKGLEFTEVYMVGMEEGLLPHHKSMEAAGGEVDEERRLCYVGVTRAKRRLTLTLALSRQKWGKARQSMPSRFLYELTGLADSPNYQAAVSGEARVSPRGAGHSHRGEAGRGFPPRSKGGRSQTRRHRDSK